MVGELSPQNSVKNWFRHPHLVLGLVVFLLACSLILYFWQQEEKDLPSGVTAVKKTVQPASKGSEPAGKAKEASKVSPQKGGVAASEDREAAISKRVPEPEITLETKYGAEMDLFGEKQAPETKSVDAVDPQTLVNEVMAALEDPSADVRKDALDALRNVDDEAINEPLLKALEDESLEVRESATKVMENVQSANILPSLEQALVSGDEDMREEALSILEDIPDPRAVDLIIEEGLLNDNKSIRVEAFDSLWFITEQEFKSYNEAREWWDANRDTFNFDL